MRDNVIIVTRDCNSSQRTVVIWEDDSSVRISKDLRTMSSRWVLVVTHYEHNFSVRGTQISRDVAASYNHQEVPSSGLVLWYMTYTIQ